jgi:hypothetical protein
LLKKHWRRISWIAAGLLCWLLWRVSEGWWSLIVLLPFSAWVAITICIWKDRRS